MRQTRRTRLLMKSLRKFFNQSIENLIILIEQEELKEKLFSKEIARETPIKPQSELILSKAMLHQEDIKMLRSSKEIKETLACKCKCNSRVKPLLSCQFSKELKNHHYSSFSMHLFIIFNALNEGLERAQAARTCVSI